MLCRPSFLTHFFGYFANSAPHLGTKEDVL